MKYISLNWTLALKFSIGKKKRMRDCRILMAHVCTPQKTSSAHNEKLVVYKIKSMFHVCMITSVCAVVVVVVENII